MIQIAAVMEEEGQICPFVSDNVADKFAVYEGEPGNWEWVADFRDKDTAYRFIAALYEGVELEDKTYST